VLAHPTGKSFKRVKYKKNQLLNNLAQQLTGCIELHFLYSRIAFFACSATTEMYLRYGKTFGQTVYMLHYRRRFRRKKVIYFTAFYAFEMTVA